MNRHRLCKPCHGAAQKPRLPLVCVFALAKDIRSPPSNYKAQLVDSLTEPHNEPPVAGPGTLESLDGPQAKIEDITKPLSKLHSKYGKVQGTLRYFKILEIEEPAGAHGPIVTHIRSCTYATASIVSIYSRDVALRYPLDGFVGGQKWGSVPFADLHGLSLTGGQASGHAHEQSCRRCGPGEISTHAADFCPARGRNG